MRKWITKPGATLLAALACQAAAATQPGVTVRLAHDAPAERAARVELERLLKEYDLSKWMLTRQVVIDKDEIPHSHPVLTLHTRHNAQADLLLSTFVHEQLHWHLSAHRKQTLAAVQELKSLYPDLPVGHPEGADSRTSNWEHLIVIYLEAQAGRELVGPQRSADIMAFWSADHYKTLVKTVLKDEARIGAVLQRHGLLL